MLPERVIRAAPPRVEEDAWRFVPADFTGAIPEGAVLLPLAVWNVRREELLARGGRVGVWLQPEHDPGVLEGDLQSLALVAVHFPKAADGRGYSTAVLLRRLGFRGELRAFGDVGRDHLFFLRRCGFDAFSLAPGRDPYAALAAFDEFTLSYQGAVDDPRPLFRRPETGDRPRFPSSGRQR